MEIDQVLPFTFYENEFSIYFCDDRKFYVPLGVICDAIGIDANTGLRILEGFHRTVNLV